MKDKIINKLQENFNPDLLEVINNSHLHGNHFKADNPEHHNQTHFLIKISSKKFENLKKIEMHRKINEVLKEEFKNGLHALEIKVINL
jgi:BolA protein